MNEEPVGQVRITVVRNEAVISYSISQYQRERGYGKLILKLLETVIADKNIKLIGKVKKNNIASQLIFKSLGYQGKEFEEYLEYTKIINREV